MGFLVPTTVIFDRPQTESPAQIDYLGPCLEQARSQFHRHLWRCRQKHELKAGMSRKGEPARTPIIQRPRAVRRFAMFEQYRLDLRMPLKNGDQFSAAITAETNDSDRDHD